MSETYIIRITLEEYDNDQFVHEVDQGVWFETKDLDDAQKAHDLLFETTREDFDPDGWIGSYLTEA